MTYPPKICTTCKYCNKVDCNKKTSPVPPPSYTTRLRQIASEIMIISGTLDICCIVALCFFVRGSHQQDNTWRAAWDAYYCAQMIIPVSIMIAASSSVFIIALYVVTFKTTEV